MTVALPTLHVRTPDVGAVRLGRAGLREAVRAEWTKLVSLRSTTWTMLITLAGTLLVTYLATNGATHHHPQWYQGFDPTDTALSGLAAGSLVIGVLSVLAVTGEYGSGTIRSSLAATPRRPVFIAARVVVVGAVALAVGMVLSFGSFFLGQAILSAGGAPHATLAHPGVVRVLIESGAFLALLALFGLGIGAIIRHSAGAIATFVGCTLLLPLLLHNVSGNPGRFTPEVIYGNSVAAVVPVSGALSSTAGLLLMAFYSVAALTIGVLVLTNRDA